MKCLKIKLKSFCHIYFFRKKGNVALLSKVFKDNCILFHGENVASVQSSTKSHFQCCENRLIQHMDTTRG